MQSIEHEERKDLRNSLYIQIIHSHWTWEGRKPKSSRFPPPGLGDYLGRGTNEHMKACSGSMLIFFFFFFKREAGKDELNLKRHV